MTLYDYEIGASYGAMVNLESLTAAVNPPKSSFRPNSQRQQLGDGTVRGGGWATAEWRWGFVTQAQRDQLRTFCTGASSEVYIKTRKNDADAYQVYTAVMIWPEVEEKIAGRRLDFVIQFQNLQEYTP